MSPRKAEAQYKNRAFGVYVGPSFLLAPQANPNWFQDQLIILGNGQLSDGRVRPDRHPFPLAHGTLHLEFLQKISLESWFLKFGFSMMLTPSLVIGSPRTNSIEQKAVSGMVFWFEPSVAPRVYLATDNVRPFIEFGFRFAIPVYTSQAGDILPGEFKFMPGGYAALGLELIVARDIALSLVGRYSLFGIVNYSLVHMVDALLGVVFYL